MSRPNRMTVVVTGAFLVGRAFSVDSRGYSDLQDALTDSLDQTSWERFHPQTGTFASGGGFLDSPPLVLLCRRGGALRDRLRTLLAAPEEPASRDWFARHARNVRFLPTDIAVEDVEICIYTLGVAVLTATLQVPVRSDVHSVARTVKAMAWLREGSTLPRDLGEIPSSGRSPLAEALQNIAQSTCKDFNEAVRTDTASQYAPHWLPAISQQEIGRLLWLHPIMIVETAEGLRETLAELTPPFHRIVEVGDGLVVKRGQGVFAPGIGWSAMVVVPDSGADQIPLKLTLQNFAYYALYMQFDRALLHLLSEPKWSQERTLTQLERDADVTFSTYRGVMDARARLDTVPIGLGGDELAIWQEIADLQKFYDTVGGVERKIGVLHEYASRRLTEAKQKRDQRFERIVSVLGATILGPTLVAGAFGANTAIPGEGAWWGFGLMAALMLLSGLILWAVLHDSR